MYLLCKLSLHSLIVTLSLDVFNFTQYYLWVPAVVSSVALLCCSVGFTVSDHTRKSDSLYGRRDLNPGSCFYMWINTFPQCHCLKRLSNLKLMFVLFQWHDHCYWASCGSAALFHWTVCLLCSHDAVGCVALQCHLESHWESSSIVTLFWGCSVPREFVHQYKFQVSLYYFSEVCCEKFKCHEV